MRNERKNKPTPTRWSIRVSSLRCALGWSISRLAHVSGVDRHSLRGIEQGKFRRPNLKTIHKIRETEAMYARVLADYHADPKANNRLKIIEYKHRIVYEYGKKIKVRYSIHCKPKLKPWPGPIRGRPEDLREVVGDDSADGNAYTDGGIKPRRGGRPRDPVRAERAARRWRNVVKIWRWLREGPPDDDAYD